MSQTHQSNETWEEIEGLVEQLADLAKTDISAHDFYAKLLHGAASTLNALGGAIWFIHADDKLRLGPQLKVSAALDLTNTSTQNFHKTMLQSLAHRAEGATVLPGAAATDDDQSINPSDYLVVLQSVFVDDEPVAIIELFQDSDLSPAVERGHRQLVAVLAEVAADFHRNWQLRQLLDRDKTWDEFEQFLRQLHTSGLNVDRVAFTAANEGRRLIECDRVSLLVNERGQFRVRAISGVESLDDRSTIVRQMQKLSAKVARVEKPVWYQTGTPPEDESLRTTTEEFVSESRAEWFGAIPLFDTDNNKIIGVLIAENFSPIPNVDNFTRRTAAIAGHAAAALCNATEIANLPLIGLSRGLAKLRWLVQAKQLSRTSVVALILFIVVGLLVIVPADFYVEARGELQPVRQETIFAPYDGNVESLPLSADRVVANLANRGAIPASMISDSVSITPLAGWLQSLAIAGATEQASDQFEIKFDSVWTVAGNEVAVLRNSDLQYEMATILGDIQTTETELATVLTTLTRLSGRRSTAEEDAQFRELSAKRVELLTSLTSLRQRLKIVGNQIEALTLRATIDGQVQTWDVVQKLQSRPVRQGQQLMTIVDPTAGWTVDVFVPDKHIGFVNSARAKSENGLEVSFVVKSDSSATHTGRIKTVAMATDSHEVYGPSVLVSVEPNDAVVFNQPRPGTTVVAKIHCGRTSIGYVWLHDLIETVRTQIFF